MDNGRWKGKWIPVARSHKGKELSLAIPPATAVVVNLRAVE